MFTVILYSLRSSRGAIIGWGIGLVISAVIGIVIGTVIGLKIDGDGCVFIIIMIGGGVIGVVLVGPAISRWMGGLGEAVGVWLVNSKLTNSHRLRWEFFIWEPFNQC